MTENQNVSPLVSVIVLCYRNTPLLFGMLDTILDQTYKNIELIVSDDCSDDFNKNEITQYIAENKKENIANFLVLKNEVNHGTVKHIDKVLNKATGEYIIFTAADDRFSKDSVISNYISEFEANPQALWQVARCAITTTNYQHTIHYAPTETDIPYFQSNNAKKLFSRWSRRGLALPCSMIFYRKAFDVVGGIDLSYTYLEDWPLVLKLLRAGHFPIFCNQVVALHSSGGITNTSSTSGLEKRIQFLNDKYKLFDQEVEPYKDLLSKDDVTALKHYRTEIMDRTYFLEAKWPRFSKMQKIFTLLFCPRKLLWVLEEKYAPHKSLFQRKKMIAWSQFSLLLSYFLINNGDRIIDKVYLFFGLANFITCFLFIICAILSFLLEKYINKKQVLRRNLVN